MPIFVILRRAFAAAAALAFLPAASLAQSSPAAVPNVGEVAPDFSAPASTRYGLLKNPLHLSDLRGRTVVLAFFPRSRTKGCTVQMESYRDRYATLFSGGKGIVVVSISTDADTMQQSWARDANFPMVFASDSSGAIGRRYGVIDEKDHYDTRVAFVLSPDGKIVYRAMPFRELTETAYSDLGNAVASASHGTGAGTR
ncbi:MAG: redoxin domain-containing protein [Gemmatimonadaceae bacterium]|nr:redoxin domain-containing protein [Gemmatimonadaceae bacterium]